MEKTCSEKKGHPPNIVNLKERLYEKNVDSFAKPTALMHALIRDFKIKRRNGNENVA